MGFHYIHTFRGIDNATVLYDYSSKQLDTNVLQEMFSQTNVQAIT